MTFDQENKILPLSQSSCNIYIYIYIYIYIDR